MGIVGPVRRHDPSAPAASNPTLAIDEYGIGWLTLDDPERRVNVLTDLSRSIASV